MVIRIQKYDVNVQEAPYQFITLEDRIRVPSELVKLMEEDTTGTMGARVLADICRDYGYVFRFYSMSREDGIDYTVTVRGEMERAMGIW
jgi:hypothetical protein